MTAHQLSDAGWCPNSPHPLLIHHDVESGEPEELAAALEERFAANGWPPSWRYTIYDFPHFHSTAHEVIGVYRGSATVRFGDFAGVSVPLKPGDVVVIPAGVSHQRLESTADFHAVGAYPPGCEVDQQCPDNVDRAAVEKNLRRVPVPDRDPVTGRPMAELW